MTLTDTTERIIMWLHAMPSELEGVIFSPQFGSYLQERRHQAFQMQGRYDGAMSADCKEVFLQEQEACDALMTAIEEMRR